MVLAIQLCGATAALINPLQTAGIWIYLIIWLVKLFNANGSSFEINSGELKHSINLTNPKLWFGAEKIREKFDEVYANSVRPVLILLDGSTSDCLKLEDVIEEGKNKVFQPPVINPKEDIVFILFSSGTTGLPKAVALTHYNLVAARIQNREVTKGFPVQSDEVSMAILPFYHTFGISGIFENLLRSLRYVILPTFTMPKMLQTIQDFKVYCTWHYSMWTDNKWRDFCNENVDHSSSDRTCHCRPTGQTPRGAALRPELFADHVQRCGVSERRSSQSTGREIRLFGLPGLRNDRSHSAHPQQHSDLQPRGQHRHRYAFLSIESIFFLLLLFLLVDVADLFRFCVCRLLTGKRINRWVPIKRAKSASEALW